jgi:hypothetical protein
MSDDLKERISLALTAELDKAGVILVNVDLCGAALTAIEEAGYVVVPRDPTREMLMASGFAKTQKGKWSAMIDEAVRNMVEKRSEPYADLSDSATTIATRYSWAAARADALAEQVTSARMRIEEMEAEIERLRAIEASLPKTLGGLISNIYGELDPEDCAIVDREWMRIRGIALAHQRQTKITLTAQRPASEKCTLP